jgi:hypothetical protein
MRKTILFSLQTLVLLLSTPALAGSYLVFDVPFTLNGEEFSHRSVLSYDGSLSSSITNLVPDDVEITSLSIYNNLMVFAVDKPATLDGQDFTERTLISYDPVSGSYNLYQDLSFVLPPGVIIDALSIVDTYRFVFSVDIPTTISKVDFSPSDIIEYNSGVASLYLSGEVLGIRQGINLDALSLVENSIYFSIDIPSTIGGVIMRESDIIEMSGGSYALTFDAKAVGIPEGVNLTAYEIFHEYVLPSPSGQDIYNYYSVKDPIKSPDPSVCKPFAVGDVTGGILSLQVGFSSFSAAVDIYLGIYAPHVASDVYIIKSDLSLQPVSQGLETWKTNTTGPVNESLFGDIAISALPSGTYSLYLVVTPAGSQNTFYFWTTYFEVP